MEQKVEDRVVVTSFYKFQDLPNYIEMKEPLLEFCKDLQMKGTILLAAEGINSTISGSRTSMELFYKYLSDNLKIEIDNYKESYADFLPFLKMKVRLKKEIVAMGVEDLDVYKYRGKYIKTHDWDKFLNQEDVVLVDTRNEYEIKLGTFANAINPHTKHFRQFPNWMKENREKLADKKVLMFCTGGIRCEKSTALLAKEGFDVYHLEGGIIKYLEDTNNESGAWQGNCFVFDDRVALNHHLDQSGDLICRKCSSPLTTDDIRDTKKDCNDICINCDRESKVN